MLQKHRRLYWLAASTWGLFFLFLLLFVVHTTRIAVAPSFVFVAFIAFSLVTTLILSSQSCPQCHKLFAAREPLLAGQYAFRTKCAHCGFALFAKSSKLNAP
jgi:hypothetical protein